MGTTTHEKLPSGAGEEDIQFHYDLSNDFYRLWLDPEMVYSAALWKNGLNLADAQKEKIAYHIEQIEVSANYRVLDVGCGWGATLKRLVNEFQCREAVGLTLSNQQLDWVKSLKINNIKVYKQSWEGFEITEPFDGIISIGAFEHFCRPGLTKGEKIATQRKFFQFCHSGLKPGCFLSLQSISYGEALPEGELHPFITREIFPNSDLPWLEEIKEAMAGYFELIAIRHDASDYEKTCHQWRWTLKEKWDSAVQLVGKNKAKKYQLYLQLAERGFRFRQLDLLRLKLKRIGTGRN